MREILWKYSFVVSNIIFVFVQWNYSCLLKLSIRATFECENFSCYIFFATALLISSLMGNHHAHAALNVFAFACALIIAYNKRVEQWEGFVAC